MNRFNHHWPRIKQWTLRLAEFGLVQGMVQILTAVAGLMVVRTLAKHEYAIYAIANSMQATCNLLADIGIGIGVRSIGGRVWNDPVRFGQLLNTTLGLRRQFAAVSLIVSLPIAAWMLWRNGASMLLIIGLCAVIVLAVIPLLGVTAWATCAQLHGEYRRIQKLDLGNAALRCALIGLLSLTKINAILATMVGVVGNWVQVTLLRRWAHEKIQVAAPPNAADRRELLWLSQKQLPNAIFYCFQGQVTLLILTQFGNPTGIANITALGRIALLFTIFSITFANVLSPRFTRCQDPKRLPRLYLLLVGGTTLVLSVLTLAAWLLPGPFLWLLGAKYATLRPECGWVVTASCVTQIGGVMWSLNSSKAWINTQVWGYIPTILLAQITMAICLDLHQFHHVLLFNLITALAPLPLLAIDAVRGLRVVSPTTLKQ